MGRKKLSKKKKEELTINFLDSMGLVPAEQLEGFKLEYTVYHCKKMGRHNKVSFHLKKEDKLYRFNIEEFPS